MRSSELSAASVLANMAVDSAGPPAGFSVSVSCDFAAMLVTFSNLESCSTLSTFPEFLVTTNVISSWRRSGGGGSLSLGCGSTPSPVWGRGASSRWSSRSSFSSLSSSYQDGSRDCREPGETFVPVLKTINIGLQIFRCGIICLAISSIINFFLQVFAVWINIGGSRFLGQASAPPNKGY